MPAPTKSSGTAAKKRNTARSPAAKSRAAAPRKRAPAKKAATRSPGGVRARRSLLAGRPTLGGGAPALESHHIDIVALALIAIGIFLGGVAYVGWSGGALGNGAITAVRFVLGSLGYIVPAALVAGGALVLLREIRPPARPLRTGLICLTIAITLALAAGTLGIGPGAATGAAVWRAHAVEARGGIIGEGEFWVAGHLISHAGADILAVFLFIAGLILVSGAGLAGVVRAGGLGVANTGRALRDATGDLRTTSVARRPATGTTSTRSGTTRSRSRDERTADEPAEPAGASEPLLPPAEWDEGETSEFHVARSGQATPWSDDAPQVDDFDPLDPPPLTDAEITAARGAGATPDGNEPADVAEAEDGLADAPEPAEPDIDFGEEPEEEEFVLPEAYNGAAGPSRDVDQAELTPQGRYRASVTEDPDFVWRVPSARNLTRSTTAESRPDTAGQEQTARSLLEALGHFGIEARVVGRVSGPHITRYEVRLAPGVKMSKVANLKDDLAYALAATDIRILAPIPGKQAVGIEVPNARRRIVHLGDVMQGRPEGASPLTVWLGKDIAGKAIHADLAKMPHLLVAGTTGAGKSACVNAMLSSILLQATPHEVRLVLVDPKQVELNHYESIPHLLTPVITSPRKAANALQNLVREMEQRYSIMSLARTRSLPELNKFREKRGEPPLPYILCVIDELADLMMVAPADVEDSIIRLAQKARAVGMHLVLATQSPRVDVITGMIKANVPSRIAFAVSSQTDSRVILDHNGAESLLGQGDMLFSPVGSGRLQRIQGAFIDEEQILEITEAWRLQGEPDLQEQLLEEVESEDEGDGGGAEDPNDADSDPLLEEAISLVAQMGTASTSMLQRRLRLGYTRAGRLIDMLERRGIISGYEGSKPRQVLITEGDVPRILTALAEVEKGGRKVPDPVGPRGPTRPDPSRPSRGRGRCCRGPTRTRPCSRRSPTTATRTTSPSEDLPLSGPVPAPDGARTGPGPRSQPSGPPVGCRADARDRRDAARGANARQDRHQRGRDADQDPRQVPARDGERGVGPAPRRGLRPQLPAHLRRVPGPRPAPARRRFPPSVRQPLRARAAADRPAEPRGARAARPGAGPSAARGRGCGRGGGPRRGVPSWAIIGVVLLVVVVVLVIVTTHNNTSKKDTTAQRPPLSITTRTRSTGTRRRSCTRRRASPRR